MSSHLESTSKNLAPASASTSNRHARACCEKAHAFRGENMRVYLHQKVYGNDEI